jgi:GMP synthase-like glutamine amidotransferase
MDPAAPGGAFTLIASHEDQVVELPPGATLLAGTDHCPNAMFQLGTRAFGLQPHPEFTAAISRELVGDRRDLIGPERADAALASLAGPLDRDLVFSWITRFFAGSRQ